LQTRANLSACIVARADDALWKIEIVTVPQQFLKSRNQARKLDAKSRAPRVNHVDDVSRTPSLKVWQQKNFRG
jgi:hypothetical protein